tara:strand:+ start:9259 stop:11310 length:2052 start_codon:yes stop_codon:yes gene_type:complete
MNRIEQRVLRYLLARQKRHARVEAFERAVEAELLDRKMLGDDSANGSIWQLPEDHAVLFNGDMDHDLKVAQVALQASSHNRNLQNGQQSDTGDEFAALWDPIAELPDPGDQIQDKPDKSKHRRSGKSTATSLGHPELAARRDHVLSLIAGFASVLKPAEVATALLLARAIGQDERVLARLAPVMANTSSIIVVQIPVHDFVRQFGLMIEQGLVLPFYVSLSPILPGPTLSGRHKPLADSRRRRSIESMSGSFVRRADDEEFRRIVARKLLTLAKPVIIADEVDKPLPPRLIAVADIMIKGGGIDAKLIAEVLARCCNIPTSKSLFLMAEIGFNPHHLGIDDLAVAIRPGRSLTRITKVLVVLEDEAASRAKDEDGDSKSSDRRGSLKSSGKSAIEQNRKKVAGCFDVIEPAASDPAGSKAASGSGPKAAAAKEGKDHLLVENLAGYGDAKQWALDLRQDLASWRNGEVDWSDLSSRLLLSGPPGTGKTTFAKALCNTLQVPLVATSVARWLEASHLGDVLAAMNATFEHANNSAPCILFVDEIDNIGSRGRGDRNYDDYWSSLVNRLLELLDGASRTEGVIVVGATNRPERIDPALLRSGRLEQHIVIPLPDTDALMGILAHHLGCHLDAVLTSHDAMATDGVNNGSSDESNAATYKAALHSSSSDNEDRGQINNRHGGTRHG